MCPGQVKFGSGQISLSCPSQTKLYFLQHFLCVSKSADIGQTIFYGWAGKTCLPARGKGTENFTVKPSLPDNRDETLRRRYLGLIEYVHGYITKESA